MQGECRRSRVHGGEELGDDFTLGAALPSCVSLSTAALLPLGLHRRKAVFAAHVSAAMFMPLRGAGWPLARLVSVAITAQLSPPSTSSGRSASKSMMQATGPPPARLLRPAGPAFAGASYE